jgi:hypothetical protein
VLRKPTVNYMGSAQNPGEYEVSINLNIYESFSYDYVPARLSCFYNEIHLIICTLLVRSMDWAFCLEVCDSNMDVGTGISSYIIFFRLLLLIYSFAFSSTLKMEVKCSSCKMCSHRTTSRYNSEDNILKP